jgi:hypothetical protein
LITLGFLCLPHTCLHLLVRSQRSASSQFDSMTPFRARYGVNREANTSTAHSPTLLPPLLYGGFNDR